MDLAELSTALDAAAQRVQALADTLPDEVARTVLDRATPPRRTGALDATGRVEAGAVVYGGPQVLYAVPVHARDPWLERALDASESAYLDVAEAALDSAITL